MEQEVIISTCGLLNFAGFFELSQVCMYIYMYRYVYVCTCVCTYVGGYGEGNESTQSS